MNEHRSRATATTGRVADHARITSRLRRPVSYLRPVPTAVPTPASAVRPTALVHECEDACHYCYGPQTD